MAQALRLVGVLAVLVVSGYTAVKHIRRPPAPSAVAQLRDASLELEAASRSLETAHQYTGSYVSADLRVFRGLTVAYAGDSVYCIQVVRGGALYHQAGPGGLPTPGGC